MYSVYALEAATPRTSSVDSDRTAAHWKPLEPAAVPQQARQQAIEPAGALTRAIETRPGALTPADVLSLQRTVGNQAVGRLLAGHVQREETTPPWESAPQSRAPSAPGSATPTGTPAGTATRSENLPVDPQTGEAYVPYDLSAWGGASCRELSKEKALCVLGSVTGVYRGWAWAEKEGHRRLMKLSHEQPFVSFISQWLGGVPMPPLYMWNQVEELLRHVGDAIRKGKVTEAEKGLRAAKAAYEKASDRYKKFKEGNIAGAERAKQALEVAKAAGSAAASALPGGVAMQAAYGMIQETAQQVSEKHHELRTQYDVVQIVRRGSVDVALGLAGSAASGALAKQFAKLSPSAFRTFRTAGLKELNKKLAEMGSAPITRYDLLPMWQKHGVDFLASMGSKLLTEPAKITLDELYAKGKLPTKKEFLEKMAAQFWLQEGGIEAFVMWAKEKAVAGRSFRLQRSEAEPSASP